MWCNMAAFQPVEAWNRDPIVGGCRFSKQRAYSTYRGDVATVNWGERLLQNPKYPE